MKLSARRSLLATTLFVSAGVIAMPALAQVVPAPAPTPSPADNAGTPSIPETTTPPEGQTTVPSTSATGENVTGAQDIVVTGSRIPQPNLEQASPVTVVTAQEVKLQGTTRVEDLINALPQSFAAQGSNISNGATGTATVNLRGLGESRTLVLVNGKRLMPGDPRSPVADINFIPAPLIKRVDVLTGGASSVYGADAVAGVVNFIMDTNFRGVRVDAQASVFMHKNNTNDDILGANAARSFNPPSGTSVNGGSQDIAVAFGAGFNDNRGSITAYATYRKQDAVLQETRDYSFCALTATSPANVTALGRRFNCSGSATSANGTFFTNVGTFQVGPNSTFIEGSTPFNFNPFNYFQRPDERYTAGAFAEYELSDAAKPYLEAMFMDDQSVAQIAPSGVFFNVTSLNCDNPLLSAQQRDTICVDENTFEGPNGETRAVAYVGRRNVEGGGRRDDLQHTAFRIVGGVRGDVHRGLSYDTFFQFGRTNLAETYLNDFSIARSARALDVVTGANGQPVCRSVVLGIDANCVPFNIFTAGGVTPQALEYLQTPGFQRGNTEETVANANLTILGAEYGLMLPWATRGPALNIGAEYRKESLRLDVDEAFRTGDLAGQGGPTLPVEGSFNVKELFAEVDLPIIQDSFIEEFTINAGYRLSDYTVGDNNFTTNTYKIAAELAPVRDVRLRGSYNRAVRAPNVVELFSAQQIGLGGTADPCAGAANSAGLVKGLTFAQCARTGVTAAQFGKIIDNPAEQFNARFAGNPSLEPETADSYTAGIVLQPRFVPGLALTVDYFDIKIRDTISAIGFDVTISQCIQSGDPFFCSRITRAPGSGSLFLSPSGFIDDPNTNIGGLRTKGVDINGSYARRLGGMGTLNLSLVGTYLRELSTTVVEGITYDCRGFFGSDCGTPNPKWRHKFRAGFTLPNGIGVSGQWRYFSKVRSSGLSEDTDLAVPPGTAEVFAGNQQLNSISFFDLAFTANITDRFNFRLGANNILDREPPVAGSQVVGAGSGNGNTYPQVYDSLGRFLFAGVTVDF